MINQLKTGAQKQAFFRWKHLRSRVLTEPAWAQAQLALFGDDVKVPLFIQGAIHGNEYEGVDSNMRMIEQLATTPYGTDPEVDQILDGAVVIFNVIQNPDGRVAGTRANGNGFDLNRDFLTQSQSETKASVAIMQEWLPPETLDLHGYVTPTLVEATTKPHNPGIDYDLWLKWNQARIDANEAALADGEPRHHAADQRLVLGRRGRPGRRASHLPRRPAARPRGRRGWDDWGPFYTPMYSQLVGLNGSTVEMCSSTSTLDPNPTQPLLPERRPRPGEEPDRPERGAARAAHRQLVDAALRHREPQRAAARHVRDLPARRRGRGPAARAARRRSTSRTTGCTSSRPRT